MIKVFWHESNVSFLGSDTDLNEDYKIWYADVEHFHVEIIPTNIIRGNNDFREHNHRYVFLANRGVTIGYSSLPFDSVIACKAAAENWLRTAFLFGKYNGEED